MPIRPRLLARTTPLLGLCAALMVAGCGGGDSRPDGDGATPISPPGTVPPAQVAQSPAPTPAMPEMQIDGIMASQAGPYVQLSEKEGDRVLPIWIGLLEARAIALKLDEVPISRPLTPDLLDSIIEQLGGRVEHVIVSGLVEGTFYAQIVITQNGETRWVDSRPSDALALALRAGVPIFADESVLEEAGLIKGSTGSVTFN